jgi:hypothetical protein
MRRLLSFHHVALATCIVAYLVVFGALLISARGVPYVFDNNESFSSFWHAYNLYHFDFHKSCGLADEACSPDPAAHPYVHTHQGNFPRLFAWAIYVLGARDIRSQIAITTFTIGLGSILLGFGFFRRLVDPLFALIASLLLMTNYVQFTQWQVVTYRVWYTFFVFLTLLCVRGIGGPQPRRWYFLTFLNFLCLFYFEYVFTLFLTVTAALYGVVLYRRRWGPLLRAAGCGVLGAATATAILLVQVAAYMGVTGVFQDIRLTLAARDHAAPGSFNSQAILQFYRDHHVIFWPNFQDGATLLTMEKFVQSLVWWNLGPFTPRLTSFVLILCLAWLLGRYIRGHGSEAVPAATGSAGAAWRRRLALAGQIVCIAVFCGGCVAFLAALLPAPLTVRPHTPRHLLRVFGCPVLLAAGCCWLVVRQGIACWRRRPWLPARRFLAAGLLLLLAAWLHGNLAGCFDSSQQLFWEDLESSRGMGLLQTAALLLVGAVGLLLVLTPERFLGEATSQRLAGVVPLMACGLVAYGATYLLSPGYLHSGYLWRWAPFLIFFVNLLPAVAFYVVAQLSFQLSKAVLRAMRSGAEAKRNTRFARRVAGLAGLAPAMAALGLLALLSAYWVRLQLAFATLLPADQLGFLPLLEGEPYRGRTFLVNTYPLPIAAATGQWAYQDPTMTQGEVELGPDGWTVHRDMGYLWLANGDREPGYGRPEYMLLHAYQSMGHVMHHIALPVETWESSWLASHGIIQTAMATRPHPLRHQVVARDQSGYNRWVILKLDWDLPPYLKPLPGCADGSRVALHVHRKADGVHIQVRYAFAHQEGVAEAGSAVRLYCVSNPDQPVLVAEKRGENRFVLPDTFCGAIRVAVTPSTRTKTGPEYLSETVLLTPGHTDGGRVTFK